MQKVESLLSTFCSSQLWKQFRISVCCGPSSVVCGPSSMVRRRLLAPENLLQQISCSCSRIFTNFLFFFCNVVENSSKCFFCYICIKISIDRFTGEFIVNGEYVFPIFSSIHLCKRCFYNRTESLCEWVGGRFAQIASCCCIR